MSQIENFHIPSQHFPRLVPEFLIPKAGAPVIPSLCVVLVSPRARDAWGVVRPGTAGGEALLYV